MSALAATITTVIHQHKKSKINLLLLISVISTYLTIECTDGIETTPNKVYGVSTDDIETTPNEVYGVNTDGIETIPNEVYGVGTDGIETTPSEVYGVRDLPVQDHIYEDVKIQI